MATIVPRPVLGVNLFSVVVQTQSRDADGVLADLAASSHASGKLISPTPGYQLRGYVDLFGLGVQRSDEVIMPVDSPFVHHETPLTDFTVMIGEILGLRTQYWTTLLPKLCAYDDIVKITALRAPIDGGAYVVAKQESYVGFFRWTGFDDGVKAFGKNNCAAVFKPILRINTAAGATEIPYLAPLTYAQA